VTRYEDRGDHIVYKRFAGKVTLPKARIATIVNMSTGKKQVFKPPTESKTAPQRPTAPAKGRNYAQEALWDKLDTELTRLYHQGHYAESIQVAEKALRVAKSTFGPDHPKVATSLNNLAELARVQGNYAAAGRLYKQALAIHEKALGKNHPWRYMKRPSEKIIQRLRQTSTIWR
jgi:tetratricopeptide (TPR) repeat protein